MNLERLLPKNMSGYGETGESEDIMIETLQKHISKMEFRNLLLL